MVTAPAALSVGLAYETCGRNRAETGHPVCQHIRRRADIPCGPGPGGSASRISTRRLSAATRGESSMEACANMTPGDEGACGPDCLTVGVVRLVGVRALKGHARRASWACYR